MFAASLTYRPQSADLFVRESLAATSITPTPFGAGILYGFDLNSAGSHYQVRVQRIPGPEYDPAGGASFGLYRQAQDGLWAHVATLHGGYGTTGDEVVFALPLRDIELRAGGQLSGLTAFTAIGSYLTGVAHVLDEIVLSR